MLKNIRTLALHTDITPFGPYVRAAVRIFFSIDYTVGAYSNVPIKLYLGEFGLNCYNQCQNSLHVKNIIATELNGAGCMYWYRSMWDTLRILHDIIIPRHGVQTLMWELDPEGCEVRRRRRLRQREEQLRVPISHGKSIFTINLKTWFPNSWLH